MVAGVEGDREVDDEAHSSVSGQDADVICVSARQRFQARRWPRQEPAGLSLCKRVRPYLLDGAGRNTRAALVATVMIEGIL